MLRRSLLTGALTLGCLFLPAVIAASSPLWDDLKKDGRVALIRHGNAPGTGDPPGWKLDDCATQRNLSEKGRAQSRELGKQFRSNGVAIGKILSSQWCRCMETAALMELGPVEAESGFNNAFVLSGQRRELAEAGRSIIANWSGPGTLVVVTHGANILALAGVHPREGEIVVIAPDKAAQSRLRVLGRIPSAP